MDKTQAAENIESIFGTAFGRETYENFLGNLLNEFEPRGRHYSGQLIPEKFRPHITQYWRLGKYIDPDHLEMDLLVVEVKSLAKLDRARTALRNFAVDRLIKFNKDFSLIAFYSKEDMGADWRFSFIKIEHVAFQDEKGKVKTKKELTPAKRYSFLVGKHENSHTAQSQLLDILAMDYARPTIDEIENAFSIEKVTKEFFNQYKDLFILLTDHLKNQPHFKKDAKNYPQNVYRFSKKLLGQIVFLYFLQKKGWLGVPGSKAWGNGDKKFLRHQLNATLEKNGSFYADCLQYLFYEALAKERNDQKDEGYYPRFDCKIPFLNGGLFEPDYDWENTSIHIPNTIFTNREKNKSKDQSTGILDVFDRYNFTIKEDEPLEKEVAVDPEMLGKVFENMLDITERKSKGAFYTPREIVHYMCQESLIHFLDNALNDYDKPAGAAPVFEESKDSLFANEVQQTLFPKSGQDKISVSKQDIESLIRKGHLYLEHDYHVIEKGKETQDYQFKLPLNVRNHAKEIDTLLAGIKICDPAIGSGAFPVGMLHEIVNTRQVLAPHIKTRQTAYDYKRHAIHESIYGVDSDASAIDIARLRLWLSLVVDEEDYNSIKALPNLDYKIIRGNSLIGLNERYRPAWLSQIEQQKEAFCQCKDPVEKVRLKDEINKKLYGHLKASESASGFYSKSATGYEVDFDFKLFFSEVWDKNDGFDIVIGNPPYVKESTNKKAFKNTKHLECYQGKMDLWYLFGAKGIDVLQSKGVLSFIATNNWLTNDGASKFRNKVLEETMFLLFIDFGEAKIFDAGIQTMIMILKKDIGILNYEVSYKRLINKNVSSKILDVFLSNDQSGFSNFFNATINRRQFYNRSILFLEKRVATILDEIQEKSNFQLKNEEITSGIDVLQDFVNKKSKKKLEDEFKIGDGVFVLTNKEKNGINFSESEMELIKPFFTTKEFGRYYGNRQNKLWLIYTNSSFKDISKIKKFPKIKNHLDNFSGIMTSVNKPYGLHRARNEKDFKGKKIVVLRKCSERPVFTYVNFDSYFNRTFLVIKTERINLKQLISILNSQVLMFWLRFYGKMQGNNFQIDKSPLLNLPIIVDPECGKLLEILVEYVLFQYQSDSKLILSYFEQIIDGLVYELYFPDEVKKAKKEIQIHIDNLSPISDNMTDKEKLIVIQKEFDRLYDPNHPVRNHIETLDSIPVVRTIQDALKR